MTDHHPGRRDPASPGVAVAHGTTAGRVIGDAGTYETGLADHEAADLITGEPASGGPGLGQPASDLAADLALLRDPATIRDRSHALFARALDGRSEFFRVELARLPAAADYVAGVIRQAYPSLRIPYHARWRHFAAGGRDRWGSFAAELVAHDGVHHDSDDRHGASPQGIDHDGTNRQPHDRQGAGRDRAEMARIRFDLCVVSVLLDAGAGPAWRFVEPDGQVLTRSEGLAVASLHAFRAGLFSGGAGARADAAGLRAITPEALGQAFQVRPDNPLEGLAGRTALLRSLGEALTARPDLFGPDRRIGGLFDVLVQRGPVRTLGGDATVDAVSARAIFAAVLEGFGPAWPPRLAIDGNPLGDVWRHPAVAGPGRTLGLIPFHKLSQWLTYSLVEVLEDAGLRVTELDALTGLPEYRNGGLFLDTGVLILRDPSLAAQPLPVEHPAIVEWRALTVALLDRIADPIRSALGRTAEDLPLACILEGGTWAAGRRIARERRPDGGPPLSVRSDGTVF